MLLSHQPESYLWSPLFNSHTRCSQTQTSLPNSTCCCLTNQSLTCDLHCSTATPDVGKHRHLFLTVLLSHQPGSYLWPPLFNSHTKSSQTQTPLPNSTCCCHTNQGLTCDLHCSTATPSLPNSTCCRHTNQGLTCDLHCSTATPDVAKHRHLFRTVHTAVTPTRVLPVISTVQQPHQM